MTSAEIRCSTRYNELIEYDDSDSGLDDLQPSIAEEWANADDEALVVFRPSDDSRAFQVRGSRQQIDNMCSIKKGDHIGWHRLYTIWHHAIVTDIDHLKRELLVIHYAKHDGEIKVTEEWINVDEQNGLLYRFDYPEEVTTAFPPNRVIARARRYVGTGGYGFLRNNCEHFATLCKTGKGHSNQVRWMVGKLVETATTSGITVLKDTSKFVLLKLTNGVGKVILGESVELIAKSTNVVGALVVAAFEIGNCMYDIYQINKKRKSGEMSSNEFKGTVAQRVTESVFSGGLAIGGSILGGFLGGLLGTAVPVIGNIAGGFVGSIVGGFLGSCLGKIVGPFVGRFLKSFWCK